VSYIILYVMCCIIYVSHTTRFHEASCALNNREGLVSEAAELIEQELTLIGATAIEDKLQEVISLHYSSSVTCFKLGLSVLFIPVIFMSVLFIPVIFMHTVIL